MDGVARISVLGHRPPDTLIGGRQYLQHRRYASWKAQCQGTPRIYLPSTDLAWPMIGVREIAQANSA